MPQCRARIRVIGLKFKHAPIEPRSTCVIAGLLQPIAFDIPPRDLIVIRLLCSRCCTRL
ncbi:MAG: hypothetical protein JW388_1534 [Nitrospira sp.]|nr:hypothetical protein [Nitrospira sp.]